MESQNASIPDGPAWAAILAAAIGCAFFGLLVVFAAASKSFSDSLNVYSPTGDLSGKSTLSIGAWLIAWMILHRRWKRKNLKSPGKVMIASVILILLALVMTFPPFFTLFE
jgi:cell division protein FtsW (lipid II flippase)